MVKKNELDIRSSTIEYLTYIASNPVFIESVYYQTVRNFRTVHYQSDFDQLMNTKGPKKS